MALLVGQDVAITSDAAARAIDNNFFVLAAYGFAAAGVAYSAYNIYSAYETEGATAALKQLGIEVSLEVAGLAASRVAGKVLYKVGKATYPTAKAAIDSVLQSNPGLGCALGSMVDKIIIGAEKVNQTALGKAVYKIEAALLEQESKLAARFGFNCAGAAESELVRQEAHIAADALASVEAHVGEKAAEKQLAACGKVPEAVKHSSKAPQIPAIAPGTENIKTAAQAVSEELNATQEFWKSISNEKDKIWSKIEPTQEFWNSRSKIPKSFVIEVEGQKFWVAPNGSKHMMELTSPSKLITEKSYILFPARETIMSHELIFNDFYDTIKEAKKLGKLYEKGLVINGWELNVQPSRIPGGFPAIIHARPLK